MWWCAVPVLQIEGEGEGSVEVGDHVRRRHDRHVIASP